MTADADELIDAIARALVVEAMEGNELAFSLVISTNDDEDTDAQT